MTVKQSRRNAAMLDSLGRSKNSRADAAAFGPPSSP